MNASSTIDRPSSALPSDGSDGSSQQIVKGLGVIPPVGVEIATVCTQDTSVAQGFSQQDEGCIGEIHGEIRVGLHQGFQTLRLA